MAKRFTLQLAEALLPEVESELRRAVALKQEYDSSELDLKNLMQRIMLLGGALIDQNHLLGLKSRRDTAAAALKEAIEAVQALGCEIKDLDIGLIDFRTWYRGEEVYLCWRLGESGIRYWHGLSEGFQGRKEIDRDFLDHHRGDPPQ